MWLPPRDCSEFPIAENGLLWRCLRLQLGGRYVSSSTSEANLRRNRVMLWRLVTGAVCAAGLIATLGADATAQRRPSNYDQTVVGNNPLARFFGFGGSSVARTTVSFPANHRPGTIVIRTRERRLYLVLGTGQALSYGIGVGRDGFGWSGVVRVSAKRE